MKAMWNMRNAFCSPLEAFVETIRFHPKNHLLDDFQGEVISHIFVEAFHSNLVPPGPIGGLEADASFEKGGRRVCLDLKKSRRFMK